MPLLLFAFFCLTCFSILLAFLSAATGEVGCEAIALFAFRRLICSRRHYEKLAQENCTKVVVGVEKGVSALYSKY